MAFFARVVETRSFSDAARTLGVSKSAVSARVSRLEQRLGDRVRDLAADGADVAVVLARRLVDSGLGAEDRDLARRRVRGARVPPPRGIPFRPQDLVLHDCLAHSSRDSDEWAFDTDEGPVSLAARAVVTAET